jgi:polyisoprenoid-binding protein YceI
MFSTGRSRILLVVGVVVIAAVGFGGWYFFIRDDAPPPAALGECDESGSADVDVSADDIQGTWTVATDNGSPQDGTGTFAGYRIQEQLATIGANTAAGRTGDVGGDITVDGEQLTEAAFEVDMTTLQSDESRRDDRLRTEGLQTEQFPTSTFTLTEPIDIPANAEACETVNLTAAGDLELHGVTRPVVVDLEARLDGDEIVLVTTQVEGEDEPGVPVALADYEIDPPTGGPILSIEDHGTFEFRIVLTQGGAASGDSGGSGDGTGATDSSETTESTESSSTTSGY